MNKNCLQCDKVFYVRPYRINTAKFCSCSCGSTYHYQSKKKFLIDPTKKLGELNHNWKGGKRYTTAGYIEIMNKTHPYKNKQNYVKEHRLVVEKSIGRYLLPEEEVHHINGIKDDNRIENLQILTKAEHSRMTLALRPKTGKYKNCCFCDKEFYVPPSLFRLLCCSLSCGKKYYYLQKKKI